MKYHRCFYLFMGGIMFYLLNISDDRIGNILGIVITIILISMGIAFDFYESKEMKEVNKHGK